MDEKTQVQSNRDRYSARLKEKYPDKEFLDDEALFGQINDDYDAYDEDLNGYKEREKSLSDLFASNPRSAGFLNDWRKGDDPLISLLRKYGDDFKEALEDPEKQEALAQANKEYADRVTKEREYEEEYQKNTQETLATLEQVQQEHGLTDEQVDNVFEFLFGIYRDGIVGKFSKETIEMGLKALNYDADLEQADKEGEVRGRNTKIEEKLRKASKSDGTADLAGRNSGGAGTPRDLPELGAIDKDYGMKNIWERGGEKRKSVK